MSIYVYLCIYMCTYIYIYIYVCSDSPPPSNSAKMVLPLNAYSKKAPEMKPQNGLPKGLLWSIRPGRITWTKKNGVC